MIELCATSNAISEAEDVPLLENGTNTDAFQIKRRVELGRMCEIFIGQRGSVVFYIATIVRSLRRTAAVSER
jgi:hypothetical protein